MSGIPDTPESVALVLWLTIALSTNGPANLPRTAWLLDLYVDCLEAAKGDRQKVDGGAH